MEGQVIIILLGVANIFLCTGIFLYQVQINSDIARGLERLNRRLRDLEAKARRDDQDEPF
jgi:hypothetical protein